MTRSLANLKEGHSLNAPKPHSNKPSRKKSRTRMLFRCLVVFFSLGTIGGWVTLSDLLMPPRLDILGVKPICILENVTVRGADTVWHGIGLIAHVRNGRRAQSVTAVDITGRVYLTYEEYLFYFDKSTNGEPWDKYYPEYEKERPYVLIKWVGAPRQSIPHTLKPYDEDYIPLTVLSPTSNFGIYMQFGKEQVAEYSDLKEPVPDTIPRIMYFFDIDPPSRRPIDIRKEVKAGDIEFSLRAGGKSRLVPQASILEWKAVFKEKWENENPTFLFERQYGHY